MQLGNDFKLSTVKSRQSGIALPIALILTMAMALLAVIMIRGGAFNELIAFNLQQKFISFEAAQSGVEAVWDPTYLKEQISDTDFNAYEEPEPIIQSLEKTGLDSQYDLEKSKGKIDVGGEVTVQYCGEAEPIGGSLDANEAAPGLVSVLVDVTSSASILHTNAKSIVVQRAALTSMKSGRKGACTTY